MGWGSLFSNDIADLKFSQITPQDGLPHPSVNTIIQDSDGLMWMGTWNGLCRYDGYKFKVYHPVPGDSTSLSDHSIRIIEESVKGDLWIGTDNGLNKYIKEQACFKRYNLNGDASNSHTISSLHEDNSGSLWVGTREGVIYRYRHDSFQTIAHERLKGKPVNLITQLPQYSSQLMIGAGKSVYRYHVIADTLTLFEPFKNRKVIISDLVPRDGVIWFSTWGDGLYTYDVKKETLSHFTAGDQLKNNFFQDLSKDSRGNIWIGSRGDGVIKCTKDQSFIRYTKSKSNKSSLSDNTINCIYESRSGIIWLGTLMGGVNKLAPHQGKNKFNHYLRHHIIYDIHQADKNSVWLGSGDNGLIRFNTRKGILDQYQFHHQLDKIGNTAILSVESSDSLIWLGTDGNGVLQFDRRTETFSQLCLKLFAVFDLYRDDKNRIWIATWGGGLYRYNPDNRKVVNIARQTADSNALGSDVVVDIYKDPDSKVLWLGTRNGGLNKLNYSNGQPKIMVYKSRRDCANCLNNNEVFAIHKDAFGNLWLGTMGGGLNKFNPNKGTFIHYTKDDGLAGNMVYGILEDENHHLWLSTSSGISKFNPQKERFVNYDGDDGLQGDIFNHGAFFEDHQGQFYFGGPNGLNVFDPDSIRDNRNQYIPPILLTEFRLMGPSEAHKTEAKHDLYQGKVIAENQTIHLSYTSNDFMVEFAALNYIQPEENKYAYRLKGYEQQWNYHDADNRTVQYNELPGGTYVFQVKGSNNDNVWNTQPLELKIIIDYPFWQTLPFYGTLALVIGILVFFGWRKWRYHLRQQKQKIWEEAQGDSFAKENQLKTLIDNLPDFIYIKDRKSCFILANEQLAKVMLGPHHDPDELIGKTDHDLYSKELADRYQQDEQNVMDSGKPLINRVEPGIDEDGNEIIVSTTKVPVRNKEGEIIGLVGIGRDITRLKRAEQKIKEQAEHLQEVNALLEERKEEIQMQKEELENLNATKDKFFSIIGHDLKNPFNAIFNLTDTFKGSFDNSSDEEKLEMIDLIRSAAKNAYELLNNLLQWAKSQSGNIDFNPDYLDLEAELQKEIELLKANAERKEIRINQNINQGIRVYADQNMLDTVIRNLVNNAIKFTELGGHIDIRTEEDETKVDIHISDNGVGMDEEAIQSLFKLKKYRSTQGTSGEMGTGLGVIICKEFLDKHNGELLVDSQPGKGTTFTIRLPKIQKH